MSFPVCSYLSSFFLVTLWSVVVVQLYIDWIPIKKSKTNKQCNMFSKVIINDRDSKWTTVFDLHDFLLKKTTAVSKIFQNFCLLLVKLVFSLWSQLILPKINFFARGQKNLDCNFESSFNLSFTVYLIMDLLACLKVYTFSSGHVSLKDLSWS